MQVYHVNARLSPAGLPSILISSGCLQYVSDIPGHIQKGEKRRHSALRSVYFYYKKPLVLSCPFALNWAWVDSEGIHEQGLRQLPPFSADTNAT